MLIMKPFYGDRQSGEIYIEIGGKPATRPGLSFGCVARKADPDCRQSRGLPCICCSFVCRVMPGAPLELDLRVTLLRGAEGLARGGLAGLVGSLVAEGVGRRSRRRCRGSGRCCCGSCRSCGLGRRYMGGNRGWSRGRCRRSYWCSRRSRCRSLGCWSLGSSGRAGGLGLARAKRVGGHLHLGSRRRLHGHLCKGWCSYCFSCKCNRLCHQCYSGRCNRCLHRSGSRRCSRLRDRCGCRHIQL